jgi:hypothetical protein
MKRGKLKLDIKIIDYIVLTVDCNRYQKEKR